MFESLWRTHAWNFNVEVKGAGVDRDGDAALNKKGRTSAVLTPHIGTVVAIRPDVNRQHSIGRHRNQEFLPKRVV
jgi:hypothetical protein